MYIMNLTVPTSADIGTNSLMKIKIGTKKYTKKAHNMSKINANHLGFAMTLQYFEGEIATTNKYNQMFGGALQKPKDVAEF
jgi:hypothetical protein